MGNLPTIASAITFLEAELEALDTRRARVVAAIDGLRMLAGDDDEQPVERRKSPRPQQPASRKTDGTGRADGDKVLAALKSGNRVPMSIRHVTGLSAYVVNRQLKTLVKQKQVTKTGTGPRNTQYQLA